MPKAICPVCGREFIKSKQHRKYCDEVCCQQAQQLRRIEHYQRKKQFKPHKPQAKRKHTECIETGCNKPIFHSNRCFEHYKQKFPLKQYCKVCGEPLNRNEESSGLCRQHYFSYGTIFTLDMDRWEWKREERSLILLSAN